MSEMRTTILFAWTIIGILALVSATRAADETYLFVYPVMPDHTFGVPIMATTDSMETCMKAADVAVSLPAPPGSLGYIAMCAAPGEGEPVS